jgi:phospholipid-binding lipoprotein MlaA
LKICDLPLVGRRLLAAGGLCLGLVACAAPPPQPIPLNDPHEAQNRRTHDFNKAFDSALVRPVAMVFGEGAPGPIPAALDRAAKNLRQPRSAINMALQGRIEDTVHTVLRFGINSTIGLAGIFDPATAMGLDRRTADFGQTLHVWGIPEGDFIELPIASASTARDTLGIVVDFVIDPVGWVLPEPWNWVGRGINVLSRVSDRARFARLIDSILYESADSYAQSRLIYLQNRRFELGQEADDDDFLDPYAD